MMWAPVAWMTGVGTALWLAVTLSFGGSANPEALLGLAGPLASADASWLVMARARLGGPERLMSVMIKALAVKMVLFGAYIAVVLGTMTVRPVPFIVSFTVCFIGLYAVEAYFLGRLTADPGVSRA